MGCDYYIVITLAIISKNKSIDVEYIEYRRDRMYNSFEYDSDNDDYFKIQEMEYYKIQEECNKRNCELYNDGIWNIKNEEKIQNYIYIIQGEYEGKFENIKTITKYYNLVDR
uniref:Uncharacterized protein n=1 Tax=Pithovirus LCPAC101 TaxID=2506586 RepID=A0A481Z2H9_9VIRU|nr:MAG: hypothetical protein LCPAC101_02150 [Pithovirus LCPAC101]